MTGRGWPGQTWGDTGRLQQDLVLASREVARGWAACLVRQGVIIDAEKGSRLAPASAILMRQRKATGDRILLPGPVTGGPYAFADRVMGLAAFRLAYLLGARAMWAPRASELALAEANKRGVYLGFVHLVPAIMNAKKDDLCPMERLSTQVSSDWEFYERMQDFLRRAS